MPLDDLHAALGDLASQVEPLHEDALPVVRERGRRRRQRRTGIITSAAAAMIVTTAFAGVAIAGHRHEPSGIATIGSSTSAPPTTDAVCTEADLRATGPVAMPVPTRITATRVYDNNTERLDPPPAGVTPKVPAEQVWGTNPRSSVATFEIVLTSYSSLFPSLGGVPQNVKRLAWVVISHHVPMIPMISPGGLQQPGATTVPHAACWFMNDLQVFDANTGLGIIETTFGD